jgi:molecular chaperone DnaK (HSP70)
VPNGSSKYGNSYNFLFKTKPNFGDDDEEDIYIPLPAALGRVGPTVLQRLNLQDGLFKITYQEMRDYVFEPVIQKILRLIAEQLNKPNSKKPMSAMFMVGGFSQSPYLKARIREAFSNQVVTISSAPRGELAVAKGAVLLGMNPYIVSERVTKFTYGLQLRARFDPDLDPEHFRVVDNGTSFCDKRFDKIGEMNAKIPSNHTVTRKYAIKKNASIKLGNISIVQIYYYLF